MALWHKSGFFRRMMLSYCIILSIPIILFGILFYTQRQRITREKLQQTQNESIASVVSAADQIFFDITNLGDQLLSVRWLQRARSDSAILERYFDTARISDIYQDLLVYTAFLEVADDLVILFPEKGEAISAGGWGEMGEMLRLAGIETQEGQETLLDLLQDVSWFQLLQAGGSGIIPNSRDLLVVQSLDVLQEPRAVMLIRIGKGTLDNYLESLQFPDLVGLSLVAENGSLLYETSEAGAEKVCDATIKSALFSWNYRVLVTEPLPPGAFEQFSAALVCLLAALLLGFFAAYLLAALSYRPIRNLISRIGGDRQDSEFRAISDALDQLTAEKEKLNDMVTQYQNSARNNLLTNLLHGCFAEDQIQSQMKACGISFQENQHFTVLLFRCHGISQEQHFSLFLHIKAVMLAEQQEFELLETMDGNIVAILCRPASKKQQETALLIEKLCQYIREKTKIALNVSGGGEEDGLLGISKSYQAAKEHSARLNFFGLDGDVIPAGSLSLTPRCYYPTDWELQMINHLKLGNLEPSLKILHELRQENDRRNLPPAQQMKVMSMIFDTILRLMNELEMDPSEPAAVLEESFGKIGNGRQWEYLESLVRQICGRTSYSSQGQERSIKEQLLSYIDANYSNSDLSLQTLSDCMNLSASAISRLFKATVKINFYDYLCRIRMEKAKEYLRQTDEPIAAVAKKVGYENELSFKRAFIRYEGIRPREFRQNQKL